MPTYSEQAQALEKVIDLAIASVKKYPPEEFNDTHVSHFRTTYLEFKSKVLSPEPKYKNLQSLSHLENDVLTFFQESSGQAVDHFWKQVKLEALPFKRENKLAKVLERGKIKNLIEYDFIVDVLVPYRKEGLITEGDARKISEMIEKFDKRKN